MKSAALLVAACAALAAEDGLRFTMKERPSLRAGDWLKVDFRAKVQMDFRGFSDSSEEETIFDPRRVRVGVEGRLFGDVDFEVEYELLPNDHQLRDAFADYRRFRSARLRAGKFKIPFGKDQLTGPTNLDFVHRSRIGTLLAPGRGNGVMMHGALLENGVSYQAGVFQHDGEIAELKGNVPTGGRTLAARLRVLPFQFVPAPAFLKTLEAGAAMTRSEVAEGTNSLRGRTIAGDTYFDRLFVNGARTRRGVEASWTVRKLQLDSELMEVRQERRGQSLRGTDLPDLAARGWYASATHPLFGKKPKRRGFVHSALPGTSVGLIEAAVRYEQIRFASRYRGPAAPSRSTRATNVLGNSDRALTLGINWQSTPYTRFQFNAVRETLEDSFRLPSGGIRAYWTFVGRIQFTL